MTKKLLSELEDLMADTGLSAHRVGILCANNGRIVDRLRDGKRIWPETEKKVRGNIGRLRAQRTQTPEGATP